MRLILPTLFLSLIGYTVGAKSIYKVEFVPNTSVWNKGADGIVKVLLKEKATDAGEWGTICNLGISNLVAAVLCYEMGFENKGTVYITSKTTTSFKILLKDVQCTLNTAKPEDYRTSKCAFTTPSTGCDNSKALAIQCGEKRAVTVTTVAPDMATVPPINCDSKTVRFVGGTATSGRVEIQHPTSKAWGVICNIGFNENEAKVICKMACKVSDYAEAVTKSYTGGSTSYQLSELKCPSTAASINDCSHRNWGSSVPSACNQKTNAWVNCAPSAAVSPPSVPSPEVICSEATATVFFNKTKNPDLKKDMLIHVPSGAFKASECGYTVTENATYFMVSFKFTKCGGTVKYDASKSSYTNNILRVFKPVDGIIYTNNFTIPIICEVPIANKGDGGNLAPAPVTVPPRIGTDKLKLVLKIYRDAALTNEVPPGSNIVLGTQLFVRVQETAQLAKNQMAIRKCWATKTNDRNSSPKKDLIIDACPQTGVSAIRSIDAMTQSFNFRAFSFSGGTKSLYVHCDTSTCHETDTSTQCSRSCTASGRRKRSIESVIQQLKEEDFEKGEVDEGPFYIIGPIDSSSHPVSSILLILTALLLRML